MVFDFEKNPSLLLANRQALKKMPACGSYCKAFLAAYLTNCGVAADVARISVIRADVQKKHNVLSPFRRAVCTSYATILSAQEDPALLFKKTNQAYQLLRGANLKAGGYAAITSLLLALYAQQTEMDDIAMDTARHYALLQKSFRIAVPMDFYIICAVAACLGLDAEKNMLAIEEQLKYLVQITRKWDAKRDVLRAATILSYSPQPAAERFLAALGALTQSAVQYTSRIYPALAVLCTLSGDVQNDITTLLAWEQKLRVQKHFKGVSMDRDSRFVLLCNLYIGKYEQHPNGKALQLALFMLNISAAEGLEDENKQRLKVIPVAETDDIQDEYTAKRNGGI